MINAPDWPSSMHVEPSEPVRLMVNTVDNNLPSIVLATTMETTGNVSGLHSSVPINAPTKMPRVFLIHQ